MIDPVVICSFARTPMGAMQGDLSGVTSTALGAAAVAAAVARAGVAGDQVERIYMGCVLAAGLGQSPARQAALGGGLPLSVEAATVNKMCGSGMMAAMLAHDTLAAGAADVVVAGGMESMTQAPYLLAKLRSGARLGHDVVKDSMFLDGLEDAYTPGKLMGGFAEEAARSLGFTREEQDVFAIRSLERAKTAIASGAFDEEITPVTVNGRDGSRQITIDEQPGTASQIDAICVRLGPDSIPSVAVSV